MMTQETLREAGSKALCRTLTVCSGFCHSLRCRDAIENFGDAMDAAISLMQPEIDRRVAEEKAKLFERLRTPSEGMIEAGERAWMNRDLNDPESHPIRDCFRAMLTAFQQENSDG